MLRIEDVNPGLYAFVPLLAEVHSQRGQIKLALALASSNTGTAEKVESLLQRSGRRRYLLESQVRPKQAAQASYFLWRKHAKMEDDTLL